MKDFEEIHERHRLNRMFKKPTIPYRDFDELQRMVEMTNMRASIVMLEVYFMDMDPKNQIVVEPKLRENIMEFLHSFYDWSTELWNEGNHQFIFGHKVAMENLRLNHELREAKKEIETLKKQIDF